MAGGLERRKFIALLAFSVVVATIGVSLFMDNIYQARAVIIPITAKDSGGGGSVVRPGLAVRRCGGRLPARIVILFGDHQAPEFQYPAGEGC